MLLGDRRHITAQLPMPVVDLSVSSQAVNVTAESVSFTDGAAGTTQRIKLTYDKLMSEYGGRIAVYGDTSLSFTTGTVLTTEVEWKFRRTVGKDNETTRLGTMSNGEYMVDYENGYILGKSAIVTSSTTDSVAYKIRKYDIIDVAIETGDIEVGAVELKDGASDSRATVSGGALYVLDTNSADALTQLETINANTDALETDLSNISDAVYIDDQDWNNESSKHILVGGLYGSNTITSGDTGPIHLDTSGDVQVDVLSIIPGTGATNLGKAEDAGHTSGDTGVMALVVRNDTLAALATTDVDYAPLQVNASGALYVTTEEAHGTAPQAYGIDAAGADTYTTVVTSSGIKYHMMVSLQGANDAIVSIDSGTTEHFYIPANSSHVFDNIVIANSATVQGKNASAGNNYTNLAITIW